MYGSVNRRMEIRRTAPGEWLAFILHIPLALVGGVVSYVLGTIALRVIARVSSLEIHQIPTFFGEVYSPLFWPGSMLLGLFACRFTRSRSGPWIGALGVSYVSLILVWDFSAFGHSPFLKPGGFLRYEWNQLFSSACSGSECLGELFVTAPALSLVSYSVAALLGLWTKPEMQTQRHQPPNG